MSDSESAELVIDELHRREDPDDEVVSGHQTPIVPADSASIAPPATTTPADDHVLELEEIPLSAEKDAKPLDRQSGSAKTYGSFGHMRSASFKRSGMYVQQAVLDRGGSSKTTLPTFHEILASFTPTKSTRHSEPSATQGEDAQSAKPRDKSENLSNDQGSALVRLLSAPLKPFEQLTKNINHTSAYDIENQTAPGSNPAAPASGLNAAPIPKIKGNDLKTNMSNERTFFKWLFTALHVGTTGTWILKFFSTPGPFELWLVLGSWLVAFVIIGYGLIGFYRRRRAIQLGMDVEEGDNP
eukprot:CAMPEP_0184697466 /NCGR_PEP_ID=MMETSP0313-20130426/4429_1 /TAXON_ID=2792 /ORGANISM="Porphyridium aerugineum, Strain SAG 1380-2" /LENGTH=297 /DNA_ID=CAMNT_0027156273 /DNA_START=29 /DNA_END=918 /DNA_ORIENTATION=-